MSIKSFQDGFQLITDVPVKVTPDFKRTRAGHEKTAILHVADNQFMLPRRNPIVKAAHDPRVKNEEIEQQLRNSSFFVNDGNLIEMRKNAPFIQSDDSISEMIDKVGYTKGTNGRVRLQSEYDESEFDAFESIPNFATGGEMRSNLRFSWSPFNRNINSDLQLIRLVCANGMTNTTALLNAKVPVVNNWEEHMQIARIQLQRTTQDVVTKRIQAITNAPASINDCLRVQQAAIDRLLMKENTDNPETLEMLTAIYEASDVFSHCSPYYKREVFENKAIAQMCKSHLSLFTIWNMLTELTTHTADDGKTFALNKMANDVLLSRTTSSSRFSDNVKTASAFDNPEAAFITDL